MRFHVPALPGQPVVRENSHCAYTQKIRKFELMMTAHGHDVFVYEHECDPPPFLPDHPEWRRANESASAHIRENTEPGDILCLIAGRCQEPLAVTLGMPAVEFGIGYGGVFADFRVFESYAWMHTVYGALNGTDAHAGDGRFYDTVIPNYFDVDEFPFSDDPQGYLLYMGRMIKRKGIDVAVQVSDRSGIPLICAGEGDYRPETEGVEYVGPVLPDERAELMGKASAVLCPTIYLEPFGGVAVEAMLCGTPVISTDWGAFTETVIPGLTGYRARTLGEFCWGVNAAAELDRAAIRQHAVSNYSLDAIAPLYEAYFGQVLGLYDGNDWNSDWEGLSSVERYGVRR